MKYLIALGARLGLQQVKSWLPVVAVICLVVTGSVLTVNRLDINVREEKLKALRTVRDTTVHSVVTWSQAQRKTVETWASSASVQTEVEKLVEVHDRGESTADPGLRAALDQYLEPVVTQRSYQAYFIVAPNGTCIASDIEFAIGSSHPFMLRETLQKAIAEGSSLIAAPSQASSPVTGNHGHLVTSKPVILIGAPVRDESGQTIAALFFMLDPSFTFTRIMQRGQIGTTGETYGFDTDANMISSSRFDDQLRSAGLIGDDQNSILNVQILDPGYDLTSGQSGAQTGRGLSPTVAAASALRGEKGENGFGYRDYRGVEVIGAWTWVDEMGIGVVTEVDSKEAFALLRNATVTIWMLAAAISLAILFVWRQEHKSKRKIEESERRFRSATECVTDLVYDLDYADGSITWYGDAAHKLCIVDIGSISTMQGLIDRIHKDDLSSFLCEREKSIASGRKFDWVGRIVPDSGKDTYWNVSSVSLSGDPNGPRRVGACTNVTDALMQQVLAKEARTAAEEANRAKSQFLATISHDLRTPLNVIVGMHELLQREELSARQIEYIAEATKQSNLLMQIIDNVTRFTELDSENYKVTEFPLRPVEIIESAFSPYVQLAEAKGLTANCTIDSDVPIIVIGDMVLLNWATGIMADNAVKFTDEGSISVSLGVVSETESSISLKIEVSDTGCGIPEHLTEKIFSRFTQSDGSHSRPKGGTGLGLAILHVIAARLNGHVEVVSDVGKGSTFMLTAKFKKDIDNKDLRAESA